jgi:hypothetical protein
MTLSMGPLIVLYELSILLALWLDRVRPPGSRWERLDEELDDDVDELEDGLDDETALDSGDDHESRHDRPEE